MHCRRAREAISERLDGERLSGRQIAGLEGHLEACAACRAFEAGAWRLRESSRIELAPAVPDLVEPIMAAVEREASTRPAPRLLRRPAPPVRPLVRRLAPLAAALAVGLLAGSLTVGGPWQRPSGTGGIAAADVSRGVAEAATRITAYQARFAVTEHDPRRTNDPIRELTMSIWFRAPERFRLDVVDHGSTRGAGPPQDLRLVVNGDASYIFAAPACPVGVCPPREMVVRNRAPFSATATAVTDLVLPVTTLVDAEELEILGRGTVLGRAAVHVRLPFERARPLFPFLGIGGSWRPFFPGDHVDLWLDATNWFPLRYSVYPAGSRARDEWELRFGLPDETARRPVFDVVALAVSEVPAPPSVFRIPRTTQAHDDGARTVSLEEVAGETGFEPVAPASLDGLDLYRVVLPSTAGAGREPADAIVTYSEGLSWLKVGETRDWVGDGPFGPVGLQAEEVVLPNGGVAYYEPATGDHGRRLAIHTETGELYLETNLSREALLRVAASLPVAGRSMPRAWLVRVSEGGTTERVSLADAIARVDFPVELPTALPAGYVLASAELAFVEDAVGMTVYFEQVDADFGAGPIRLYQELRDELPPASSAEQSAVRVGDAIGRWTPERHQLEWVDEGVYRSLDARGLDREDLLLVATSLRSVGEASGPATASPTVSGTPS